MRSPRSVTMQPIGIPSRTLKAAIDFFALSHNRLLAGDLGQLGHRRIQHLGVLRCLAHAHVDDNLLQLRNCHLVLQSQFLLQSRTQLFKILCAQAGRSGVVRLGAGRLRTLLGSLGDFCLGLLGLLFRLLPSFTSFAAMLLFAFSHGPGVDTVT